MLRSSTYQDHAESGSGRPHSCRQLRFQQCTDASGQDSYPSDKVSLKFHVNEGFNAWMPDRGELTKSILMTAG